MSNNLYVRDFSFASPNGFRSEVWKRRISDLIEVLSCSGFSPDLQNSEKVIRHFYEKGVYRDFSIPLSENISGIAQGYFFRRDQGGYTPDSIEIKALREESAGTQDLCGVKVDVSFSWFDSRVNVFSDVDAIEKGLRDYYCSK